MKAWSYEDKLRKDKGGELARECLEEIRNKVKKGKAVKGWEEERGNFMEERGWKIEKIKGMWTAGKFRGEDLFEREK